jgi:adenosylhomocysteine nucleosidase
LEYFNIDTGGLKVVYTGIGKINASIAATRSILEYKPDLVLNVGTAGTLQPAMLGSCKIINEVIERDMIAEPLAIRGTTPFDQAPAVFYSDIGSAKCATGDSFVMHADPWLVDEKVDFVDMELFAIAKVCHRFDIPWRALKFASDSADENAVNSWQESLEKSQQKISEVFKELIV